jgi:hypothetical protein
VTDPHTKRSRKSRRAAEDEAADIEEVPAPKKPRVEPRPTFGRGSDLPAIAAREPTSRMLATEFAVSVLSARQLVARAQSTLDQLDVKLSLLESSLRTAVNLVPGLSASGAGSSAAGGKGKGKERA